jgi:hypothetical protein
MTSGLASNRPDCRMAVQDRITRSEAVWGGTHCWMCSGSTVRRFA